MIAIMLALSIQSPADSTVIVTGRDYGSLKDQADIFTGRCDDHLVSVTVEKAFGGAKGKLTIAGGGFTKVVPSGFLDDRLFRGSLYAAGLGCDGRRILFRARVAEIDSSGRMIVDEQTAKLDMRTGALSVSEPRTLKAREIRNEQEFRGP